MQADSLDALDHFFVALASVGFPLWELELHAHPDGLRAEAMGRLERLRL